MFAQHLKKNIGRYNMHQFVLTSSGNIDKDPTFLSAYFSQPFKYLSSLGVSSILLWPGMILTGVGIYLCTMSFVV